MVVSAEHVLVAREVVDVAVGVVRDRERRHAVSHLNGIVVGVFVVDISGVHAESRADNLVNLCINRTLEIQLVLLVAFVDTLVSVVAHAEMICDALLGAAHGEVVVLAASCLGNEAWPVIRLSVGEHFLHQVAGIGVGGVLQEESLGDCGRSRAARHIEVVARSPVSLGEHEELGETEIHELLSAHKLRVACHLCHTIVAVVADSRFGELCLVHVRAALCRNHNDTGSGARTVDGGRRSVFQHVDALDVLRVEELDVVADNAIDNIQRLRVGVGRRLTADFDVEVAVGTSCALRDAHTRGGTLEVAEH